jgi:hypothetical protein
MIREAIVTASLLLASPASSPAAGAAEAPRTVDMTQVVLDQKGDPVPDATQQTPDDPRCTKCGPLTLGAAIAVVLLIDHKDEPNINSLEKAKRAALATKILGNKEAVLTPQQVTEITKLMNIWTPIVISRVLPAIDPTVDLSK